MTAVWANTSFSWQDQVRQLGNQRDSADPVVVACPLLFTSVPPTAAAVTGVQLGYLAEYPGGPKRSFGIVMDLHPVDPLGLSRPGPVDAGWMRALARGPSTVEQVLQRALAAAEAEDEAERWATDPVGYVRASRDRRTLLGRLLGCGRRRSR